MAKQKKAQQDVGINMTPMIDVVFQLIMFFMLASQYVSADVDRNLQVPELRNAPIEEAKFPFKAVINMNARKDEPKQLDYIKIGSLNVTERAGGDPAEQLRLLREALEGLRVRAVERGGELVIMLRAHETLAWSEVQSVMMVASGLGIRDVRLAAAKKGGE